MPRVLSLVAPSHPPVLAADGSVPRSGPSREPPALGRCGDPSIFYLLVVVTARPSAVGLVSGLVGSFGFIGFGSWVVTLCCGSCLSWRPPALPVLATDGCVPRSGPSREPPAFGVAEIVDIKTAAILFVSSRHGETFDWRPLSGSVGSLGFIGLRKLGRNALLRVLSNDPRT